MTSFLQRQAAWYASIGFRVFPLYPMKPVLRPHVRATLTCTCGWSRCGSPGTHPMVQHREATADRAQVRAWWTESPDAGIGLATGYGSRLLVVRVEDSERARDNWQEMEDVHGRLRTFTSSLDGERHYYTLIDHAVPSHGNARVGVHVHADGGWVVAPPSPLPSGRHSEWGDVEDVFPAPQWLVVLAFAGAAAPQQRRAASRRR